jgi:NAD(P)-dependent dehydrogenase (short-subunit alcohol dehydrogenase family)
MAKPESKIDIDIPNLSEKNVLVTGSTSGIGKEVAMSLGRLGADVYVHGRNKERGQKVSESISSNVGVSSQFIRADFSNLNEVRSISKRIDVDNLHYLINNAGGYFVDDMKAMGVEYTFAVNHIAPFVLTKTLLPKLKSAESSRVVNVASDAHRAIKEYNIGEVKNDTNGWSSYCRSKASNIMFTNELSDKLPERTNICSVHPGSIPSSKFMRNRLGSVSKILKIAEYVPIPNVSSKSDGASRVIHSMFVDNCSSRYYVNKTPTTPSEIVLNEDNRRELWKISKEISGIDKYVSDN